MAALAGPPPQPSDFSLSGTVVNGVTGAPVRNVLVSLSPSDQKVETDAAGGFKFSHLEAETYMLGATKLGFEAAEDYVELAASREGVVIRLTPLATIRGIVKDSEGEPVEGVTVVALRSQIGRGWRRIEPAGQALTDDRGYYRIGQLVAGQYVVQAAGFQGLSYEGETVNKAKARDAFAPVYFGGAHDAASATPVPLAPAAEGRADFSVTLQPGHRILGHLANLKPYTRPVIQLLRGQENLGLNRCTLELGTGGFRLDDVLDGSYRLRAFGMGTDGQPQVAEQEVIVAGKDVEGISMTLGPGLTVKGTVRGEGPNTEPLPTEQPEPPDFGLVLEPVDSLGDLGVGPFWSNPAADGAFQIASVLPGRYRVHFRIAGPRYFSSIRAGNTDLLATSELTVASGAAPDIEVVLRSDGGSIEGTFAPEAAIDDDVLVLLVPEALNRPPEVMAVEAGEAFRFAAVAPGSYRLHAWDNSAEVEYHSPEVLRTLAHSGTRVEVRTAAETKIQLQKLSEIPK